MHARSCGIALHSFTPHPLLSAGPGSLPQGFLCMKESTVEHAILSDLSGVLRPGVPTLLLGPPASGATHGLEWKLY